MLFYVDLSRIKAVGQVILVAQELLKSFNLPLNRKILYPFFFNVFFILFFSCSSGMGQFNPVTMQNVQMSQSPVGAPRSASPMTHPPQMGMGTIPAVSSKK